MLCAVLILERMPVGELLMGRSCEATLDGVSFTWMVIRGVDLAIGILGSEVVGRE